MMDKRNRELSSLDAKQLYLKLLEEKTTNFRIYTT